VKLITGKIADSVIEGAAIWQEKQQAATQQAQEAAEDAAEAGEGKPKARRAAKKATAPLEEVFSDESGAATAAAPAEEE